MIETFDVVMNDPNKDWPTFDDFEHGRVFIDKNLVKRVEDLLKEHRRCLIRGAEGRGKTVLARIVANNRPVEEKGWIWFFDLRESIIDRIDHICNQFERAAVASQEKTLIIVENTHTPFGEKITPKLVDFANKHREASFIFTSRKILPEDEQFLIDPFEEWEKKGWCVDLEPGLEEAHDIIKTFIAAEKSGYSPREQDIRWITNDFEEGTINLRRLNWYLETWKEKRGCLSAVKKEDVFGKVRKKFLLEELVDAEFSLFLEVAGVFQFDVKYYGMTYDNAILPGLVKRGLIGVKGDYYRLPHTSDAAYVIETEAFRLEKEPVIVTTKILKKYIQNKPENYFGLMRALFQSKEKRILAEIFKDQKTYDAIFDMIKQDRIRVVSSVLGYLTWACGNERGLVFWSQYKKLGGDSLDGQREKLKSKLTEASLTEVYFLLYILNKVDFNERVWLANEVFNEDDLVQKAEDMSFSTINNLMRLLPNEKISAVLSKLDPTDIADKAKSSTAQQIMWFLKYCSRDPSNINFVNSFLFALNKEGKLANKLKNAPFSTIKGIFVLLPSEKASAFISNLDPKVIADKAKSSSAQSIMWFLHYCSKDPSNINFVKSFLLAINKDEDVLAQKAEDAPFSVISGLVGVLPSKIASAFISKLDPDDLAKKAKNSDLSIVWGCLKTIKKINPDFHEDLKSSISPYWLQICLSSNLNNIVHVLYLTAPQTKFARLIAKNVASTELSGPIRKLYSHPETEPLKVLGKLLDSVHQIAFVTDKDAVEKIAQQIVNNINLKAQEKYNLEQLSLLIKNAKKCNELAWEHLCSRILSELNLTDYISIPFDKGLAMLVWEIYQYDEEKAQELANEIFKLDFNKLLDSSDAEAVKLLLWNLLQINESEVRSWIQNMEVEKFLSKILSASTQEAFWHLWNLYQIDEEKGKRVAQSLANNVLSDLTAIETKDIPLLGFFVFCDIKMDLNNPIPSPCEITEEAVENLKLAEMAFRICFLEKEDDTLLNEFSKELGRHLFLRNLTFPIKEMIEKHPIENTRHLFMEIFTGFDLPKEPDSTFLDMIYTTQTYLDEKKEINVAFSQLRDFFLNNPTNNPIFKSVEDSNMWLNLAIKQGIYHVEQVPHRRNPSWKVNLLSLNTDVVFSFFEGNEV